MDYEHDNIEIDTGNLVVAFAHTYDCAIQMKDN